MRLAPRGPKAKEAGRSRPSENTDQSIEWSFRGCYSAEVADKHLNLFYTYNRDTELIENNLTRAFVVLLSVVSGEARQKILSTLLGRYRKISNVAADVEDLEFADARFALQSNINQSVPKNSRRKLLLTISTEPLVLASGAVGREAEAENKDGRGSVSIPDAWIYGSGGSYCVLIEAKVGTYPLDIDQLQAHARGWFGSDLQDLDSRNSLCSVTWIDVVMVLREVLNDRSHGGPSDTSLVSHLAEFLGFYGYRLFDGFDLNGLHDPPGLTIGLLSHDRAKPCDSV